MPVTRHTQLQGIIATGAFKVFTCHYCEGLHSLPEGEMRKEATLVMPDGTRTRPDVSIWRDDRCLATVEIIDTNLSSQALEAQRRSPTQSVYVHVDGEWWCSAECYEWDKADLDRVCPLPHCECCGRLFIEVAYPNVRLYDWEVGESVCLECGVQHLDGSQYKSPGQCMNGVTPDGKHLMWEEDEAPEVLKRFYKLCDAVFWSMVWTNREANPNEAWKDESATTFRLGTVEAAMDAGDWEKATELLAPIGAPGWSLDRDNSNPLCAWDPGNCRRTATAWQRLKQWRISRLPLHLRPLVRVGEVAAALWVPEDESEVDEEVLQCSTCGDRMPEARWFHRHCPACGARELLLENEFSIIGEKTVPCKKCAAHCS